jgi:hypothetical protein
MERRSHEISIGMGLGARGGRIVNMIAGCGLAFVGAPIGVGRGLRLTGHLRSLLYGVTPHDPPTLISGCAVLMLMATAAAYLPEAGSEAGRGCAAAGRLPGAARNFRRESRSERVPCFRPERYGVRFRRSHSIRSASTGSTCAARRAGR